MDEPPTPTSNPETPTAPGSPQQSQQYRDPRRAPVHSIEPSYGPREIDPSNLTPLLRDGPFSCAAPGPSQCSDSSSRPHPHPHSHLRTPSSPLGTPVPSSGIGAPNNHFPSESPRLFEPEPLWHRRGRTPQVDESRHVPYSPNISTQLALSRPIRINTLPTSTSATLPAIRTAEPIRSLPSLSTVTSAVPATQNTLDLANTPHQRESATYNAMAFNNPAPAPVNAVSGTNIVAQIPSPSTVENFCPDARHIMSTSPESIKYWEEILDCCNADTRITVPHIGKRDIFVVGNVTVKSDHLDPGGGAGYHLVDANEVAAVKLVRDAIPDIQIPQTYFSSKLRGHDILIQSRIPGQPLDSIWPRLTTEQKESFKSQARDIIIRLRRIAPDTLKYPRYFVAGSEKESQRRLSAEEVHSLSPTDTCDDLGVAHNDMVMSNIIVDNDKITGLIGWSNAGYFNWRTVSRIHAKVRCIDSETNAPIPECHETKVQWHDLYEHPQIPKRLENNEGATPKVSTPTMDLNPMIPSEEGSSQTPALTPKKVADMKRSSVSRASSVDRSSPAPSVNSQPTTKKKGSTAAAIKKGTAKRAPAANKKRKINELGDVEDVSSAKASPLSKSSAQRNKKQDSQSAAGSPAPEQKGPKKARLRRGKLNSDDDDEDNDESALFCICRKPDNHTWMIACDGGCEDWFHGRCMKIDPKDADLIDKYICPTCETKSPLRTTWKPMCRLRECRQPARVDTKPPSKYCCDQHGIDYMKQAMSRGSRQPRPSTNEQGSQNEASRGGILNLGDLKSVVSKVGSADQFRKLGASPLSAQQEEVQARLSDAMAAPGPSQNSPQSKDVDFESEADKVAFSSSERQRLNQLRMEKLKLDNRKEMLQARDNFIIIAKQRVKHAFDRLKAHGSIGNLQLKDLCGFDNRFSLSDEEFDEWRKSDKGALLLAEITNQDNSGEASTQLKNAVDAETIEELLQTLCLKKRCERHKQWTKVMQQEVLFEQSILKEQSDKCHRDAEELVRKAVLRMFSSEN
ncbi:protein kinase subdomain-containing protein [Nannizzia gypsea CBS 118893]|uniref:Protein kinase subdomain-containing protein n=1 Tax=Arthroderma gypseum (strain ATCC MYA-4604 / CBS 118893) TaxID=535722 RepID=E5R3C6_ARTGP|nr:protein kinase subdomain-containing protein [Nannizzia gypsea CBS 118893]EFQ97941.1 protein kinase subdomain-containing protein [Nannizzia gypsea CBS 118893]